MISNWHNFSGRDPKTRKRFQADADLNQTVVQAVLRQEPEIDFQTAPRADLEGLGDLAVLTLAGKQNRLLVSHDKKTLPYHFATFLEENTSAGVILIPQSLPIAQEAANLILIWSASEAEEWKNRIGYLPL